MTKFIGIRWLIVASAAAMLLVVGAACGADPEVVEVVTEVVVEKEVPVEVVKEVVVEKEVVKTVAGPEKIVEVEVQGKKYVTDPTTGKVLSAPEYGGTLTYTSSGVGDNARNYPTRHGSHRLGGVAEMLAIADWGISRAEHDHMKRPVPLWVMIGQLADPRGADGIRFKTVWEGGLNFKNLALADVAASYWAAIGVDVEITQATDNTAHNERMRERTYEGLGPAYIGYDRNPTFLMNCYAHSEGGCNRPGANDPELDALIDAALAATSFEEQQRLVKEADASIIANHYYVWYFKIPEFNVVQPWLIGFNGEYFLGFEQRYGQRFARIWIDSQMKEAMCY